MPVVYRSFWSLYTFACWIKHAFRLPRFVCSVFPMSTATCFLGCLLCFTFFGYAASLMSVFISPFLDHPVFSYWPFSCSACRCQTLRSACFLSCMTRNSTGMCVCSCLACGSTVGQLMMGLSFILTLWWLIKRLVWILFCSLPSHAFFDSLVLTLITNGLQGTHMYAQIPADASPRLMQDLEEGKVFLFKKFLCNPSRAAFKAVESPFMMQCTRYTTAVPQEGLEDGYPYCTYNLVPFPEIPKPGGKAPYFLGMSSCLHLSYALCYRRCLVVSPFWLFCFLQM